MRVCLGGRPHHDIENPGPQQRKLVKALAEFATYIQANAGSIPNYDERYRADEPISSSFAESTINQVALQIRTRILNDDLANEFHRWYPSFTHTPDHENIAA